jgi:hypothetical protein
LPRLDLKPSFYLWVPGRKRVSLLGLPWSPEFMEARARALSNDWTVRKLGVSRRRASIPAFSDSAPSNTAPLLLYGVAILFGYVQAGH